MKALLGKGAWGLALTAVIFAGCRPDPPTVEKSSPGEETAAIPRETLQGEPPDDPVVATVGELEIRLHEVLEMSREPEANAKAVRPGETLDGVRARIRRHELDKMIDRRLLVLGAMKHPEWVPDSSCEAEVQRRLAELGPREVDRRREQGGFATTEDFIDHFRRYVREELMKTALIRREVDERLHITEEEIRKTYEEHRDDWYHRPDSWEVYHITQYLPRNKAEELPRVLAELEKIRVRVSREIESIEDPKQKGRRMLHAIREHRKQKDSESGFAFLYDTPEVRFDPLFVSRVKEAVIGDLSPVIELAGNERRVGACFFLVAAHHEGEYAPFERVRENLRARLLEDRRDELLQDLYQCLRENFPVTLFEDLLYRGLKINKESRT